MFDMNIGTALYEGQMIPVPLVQQFVVEALRNEKSLQDTAAKVAEQDKAITSLKEDLERVEGQRNQSNREIESLRDQLFKLDQGASNGS